MAPRVLQLGTELKLPANTVTSTIVIYGGRGMGKSNLASDLCEELKRLNLRFRVIDPMGVFWGLRHSEDGKGPGIPVLILGGRHGDIPIQPTGGAVVADLAVDEDVDLIIDISRWADGRMWSLGNRIRFVTDYCTRLYERQGERMEPMMQIIDEAGRFCPQNMPKGAVDIAICAGAVERLVEEGRNIGIGVTTITQRSARMSKTVSELSDCMIAFRTVGPRSIAAIVDWFGEHIPKERQNQLIEQIRKLPIGRAMVVSPGWLEVEEAFDIRPRQTFDSSPTPSAQTKRKTLGAGNKIDLSGYQDRMKETIEAVKDNDPKALKAQIKGLEEQLKKERETKAPEPVKPKIVEVQAIDKKTLETLDRHIKRLEKLQPTRAEIVNREAQAQQVIVSTIDNLKTILEQAQDPKPFYEQIRSSKPMTMAPPATAHRSLQSGPALRPQTSERPIPSDIGECSKYARALAHTLMSRFPLWMKPSQLAILSGRSSRSSAFDPAIRELDKAGFIEWNSDKNMRFMPSKMPASGGPSPRTSREVREQWRRLLPTYESSLYSVLIEAYPEAISLEELSARSGKSQTSSAFDPAVRNLIKNELAERSGNNWVKASDDLFE